MKLAFIGGFAFSPKGTIRSRAFPLATELAKRGHQVTIFLVPHDNPEDSGRIWERDRVCVRNVPVLPASFTGRLGWNYAVALRRLLLEVKTFQPDVIHVFKPKGFAGAAATYFYLRGNRRLVLDCDDWEGWGGWNDVKKYPRVIKEYIDWQERWLISRAPAITVASRALYDRARQLRDDEASIYYVPNCGPPITDEKQRAANKDIQAVRGKWALPEGLLVLYSGHFDETEDIELFCRASAPVLVRQKASAIFVGEGPKLEWVRQFYAQHADIGFRCFPQLPYESFLELVSACDVTAFPYRSDRIHSAKCSARIIDYMAMGRAVITSNVGQNSEYIVDGESGVLTPPGDPEQFAAHLDRLLASSELRMRLGSSAARRIATRFNWGGVAVERCLTAYENVLGRKSSFLSPDKHVQCPVSSS